MEKYRDRAISMRLKIFLFIVTVVFAALLAFITIFTTLNVQQVKTTTQQTVQATVNQTSAFLQEQAYVFRNNIDNITLNENYSDLFNRDCTEQTTDPIVFDLLSEMKSIPSKSNISYIKIYTDSPIIYQDKNAERYGKGIILPLDEYIDTNWYSVVSSRSTSYGWTTIEDLYPDRDADDYILFTRNLPFVYLQHETYYVAYVKKSFFENLLDANITDNYSSFFVMNDDSQLLFGTNELDSEASMNIQSWLTDEFQKADAPIPAQLVNIDGEEFYIGAQKIENTNLILVYTLAFYQMQQDNVKSNIIWMTLIVLIVLPFIFLFSLLISKSVTRPLERLKDTMMQVSDGNFDVPVLPLKSDNEVRALTRYFNYMLEKISSLMDQQYDLGKQIKELELKSLQAQINPHFLYNTLELIKWKAIKYEDNEIQEIVTALSGYYRKSLSKGADFVPLDSELQHITVYTLIQNKRFDECTQLIIEVSPSHGKYVLPKLTLQPLIENSIIHGILESEEGTGWIKISTKVKSDKLIIQVQDNGCGMESEKLDTLLTSHLVESPLSSGYGVYNINQRIKLAFGNKYGLEFDSEPGIGTTASIRIPLFEGDLKNV